MAYSRDEGKSPFIKRIIGDAIAYSAHHGGLSDLIKETLSTSPLIGDEKTDFDGYEEDVLQRAFSHPEKTDKIFGLQIKILESARNYQKKISGKLLINKAACSALLLTSFSSCTPKITHSSSLYQQLIDDVIANEQHPIFEELLTLFYEDYANSFQKIVSLNYSAFLATGKWSDDTAKLLELTLEKIKDLPCSHPIKISLFGSLKLISQDVLMNALIPQIIARQAKEFLKKYTLLFSKIDPNFISLLNFTKDSLSVPTLSRLTHSDAIRSPKPPTPLPGDIFPPPRKSDAFGPVSRSFHSLILTRHCHSDHFFKPAVELKSESSSASSQENGLKMR